MLSPANWTFLLVLLASAGFSLESRGEGRRYALIVGVKKYRASQTLLPTLSYTERDSEDLAEVLRNGKYDVTLMTQRNGKEEGNEVYRPDSHLIRDQLSAIVDNPNLKQSDFVIVALAGHGVQYEFTGATGEKTPRFYFCPADADLSKVRVATDIRERNNLIDLEELYATLDASKAGGKLLLVDACRNDPTKQAIARSVTSSTLPPLPPPPGGTAAFFSCSAHQQAFEDKGLQHGVFFHHVIEALKGQADSSTLERPADGKITLSELSEYVSTGTYDFVRKNFQAKQAPELKGTLRLSIPLITVARTAERLGSTTLTPASIPPRPAPNRLQASPSPYPLPTHVEEGSKGEIRAFGGDLKARFCWCPEGTFEMGSPVTERERFYTETQVHVTLKRGFWMGQTEVTQGLWASVMKTAPWAEMKEESYEEGEEYPAVYVNWDEARQFCEKLTEREQNAARIPLNWSFRLPMEAEWEYACRAGTSSAYCFGNDPSELGEYAWFDENAWLVDETYAHPVAMKKANKWNLYDMHGNVYELCSDVYRGSPLAGPDAQGPSAGGKRVVRGGSWGNSVGYCRSAFRSGFDRAERHAVLGFRIMLSQTR